MGIGINILNTSDEINTKSRGKPVIYSDVAESSGLYLLFLTLSKENIFHWWDSSALERGLCRFIDTVFTRQHLK